ncbi:glycosyltransferase [bacterium]|nr:glycosyltransferase [bacterium]
MSELSVVIVSYNVRDFLKTTLQSLALATKSIDTEIFVVDNASHDDSVEMVRKEFPEVQLIALERNYGFAKANNIALKKCCGQFLLLLNPDCILEKNALHHLINHLKRNPEYGAVGPKLINQDGTFQATAKRGFPTPWRSFCKLSGLSGIFPESPVLNGYELGYLSPDKFHEIDVLCGAVFMITRSVYEGIGGLNEEYFMFGEDIDWSKRIHDAGWKIGYVPEAIVLHYKGQSSRDDRLTRDRHFFEAMRIYVREHQDGSYWSTLMIEAGTHLGHTVYRWKRQTSDWLPLVIDAVIAGVVQLRSERVISTFPFITRSKSTVRIPVTAILLSSLNSIFSLRAAKLVYSRGHTPHYLILNILLEFAQHVLRSYFSGLSVKSRDTSIIRSLLGATSMVAWRMVVREKLRKKLKERVAVVYEGDESNEVAEFIRSHPDFGLIFVGFILSEAVNEEIPEGKIQVLGELNDLTEIVSQYQLKRILFCKMDGSFSEILPLVSTTPIHGTAVQVVSHQSLEDDLQICRWEFQNQLEKIEVLTGL